VNGAEAASLAKALHVDSATFNERCACECVRLSIYSVSKFTLAYMSRIDVGAYAPVVESCT